MNLPNVIYPSLDITEGNASPENWMALDATLMRAV